MSNFEDEEVDMQDANEDENQVVEEQNLSQQDVIKEKERLESEEHHIET